MCEAEDLHDSVEEEEEGTEAEYDDSLPEPSSIFERQSVRVAARPCTYFWIALVISLALSFIGLIVGEFSVYVESAGWTSRGTLIADRHSQFILVHLNRDELFSDYDGDLWEDLITNVQPGWDVDEDESSDRRLEAVSDASASFRELMEGSHSFELQSSVQGKWTDRSEERRLPFKMTAEFKRKLQDAQETALLEGCDISWYDDEMLQDSRLWPIWKPSKMEKPNTLLTEDVLRDLCLSEEVTQQALVDNDLCVGCTEGCLPPYSIVLLARLTVSNGPSLSCEDLAAAWVAYNMENQSLDQEIMACVEELETNGERSENCPAYFSSILIDESYSDDGDVSFTSSVFATNASSESLDKMYGIEGDYSRGTSNIEGAYDTQDEDFVLFYVDAALGQDMGLALASAFITAMAILIHTKSPLLTGVGILQIVLSFPLSYFVYTFIGQLDFFPFLNFIGIFVVFALGADDVFVAVDKWKNARIEHKKASTAQIAAIALPDAAGAMFLTTVTTAVAFFGTAICPVAPIKCFSVFCGLLIVMDYIMCIVLVFPALCIYDRWRHRKNCCCRCWNCRGTLEDDEETEDAEKKPSLIRRILTSYYNGMHTLRYPLLALSVAGFVICAVWAARMELPTSGDVRLLDSSNEYEKNYEWRQNILFDVLQKKGGSSAYVIWGTIPADTGKHNNPESFSQLVLDDSFDPSTEKAQVYLRDFCDDFYSNEWASPIQEGEKCPINKFDDWLAEQSSSDSPEQVFVDYCGGATGLPLAESDFHACIYNWGQLTGEKNILARGGKVEVMYFQYSSRVRFDSPFETLDSEWNTIEAWIDNERAEKAPEGVNNMYFTSEDYWWYDTNGSMLNTAYTASAIAICTGAAVILFSSRSIVLTIFSSFTIGYVLASVTAVLVAFGWTLGFLEAICFAILIGLSCDFVIHFSHSYAALPGNVNRHDRTKHALISMGPSILAAALTTIAAATVMLFTVISFFIKFGVILFVTVTQATVGSFVVFLSLTDVLGPSDPTYVADQLSKKCCNKEEAEAEEIEDDSAPSGKPKKTADNDAVVY